MVRLPKEEETFRILVCICHHTGSLIDICLKSVWNSYDVGIKVRTVVVTSTDRVFPGVITVKSTDGPAHKRNLGVHYYGQDAGYFIFLDDDVEISPYCVWNLFNEMEQRPRCGIGFSKILNMERRDIFDDCGSWITPTGFLFARAQNNQKDHGQYDTPCKILASKSATCIVRRQAFTEAGGFDPGYYILGEESDLSWRMWLKGWEAWYFPSARSWHAFGTGLKPKERYYTLDRIHFHGCKNYISLLLTNLGGLRLCLILPIHLFAWFVSAVSFAVRGQLKRSWLIFKGICWNVTNLKKTLKKRITVQAGRKVSEKELWPKISYSPSPRYYVNRLVRYVCQGLHGVLFYGIFNAWLITLSIYRNGR